MSRLYNYQSSQGIAKFLTFLIAIDIVLSVISMGSDVLEIQLLDDMQNGREFTQEQVDANDSRQALIGISQLALIGFTAIVFLRWVFISAKNAQSFSDHLMSHSPGWCVGWYFVPIMNLFRPYQAMKEIWQASQARPNEDWFDAPTPGVVNAWWGLWILCGIVGQANFRFSLRAESIEEFIASDVISIGTLAVGVVLDFVVIAMISRLVKIQEHRNAMTDSSGAVSRCPACGEAIDRGSRVCPMCGKDLPRPQIDELIFDD